MTLRIAIHQPELLPYQGFFEKLKQADILVILDDVEFTKNNFQNRNRIRSNSQRGFSWLSIPVQKGQSSTLIKDIKISDNREWKSVLRNRIINNYRKAPGFFKTYTAIDSILTNRFENLIDYNLAFLYWLLEELNIKIKFISSSMMNIEAPTANMRLVNICREFQKLDPDIEYISGVGGKNYLKRSTFRKYKIKIKYIKWEHDKYKQQYEPFLPNMSIIDYLMNKRSNDDKVFTNISGANEGFPEYVYTAFNSPRRRVAKIAGESGSLL